MSTGLPSVYVGNLHSSASEAHLYEMFSQVGPVYSARVCRDTVTRRPVGHGFVNFLRPKYAETAQKTMNGKMLLGQPMHVTRSEDDSSCPCTEGDRYIASGNSVRPCFEDSSGNQTVIRSNMSTGLSSIHVGNLHSGASEVHLFEMFSQVGPVLSIRVCRDVVTRRSLGYGYVNFQQPEHVEAAQRTMNGKMLLGQPMHVTLSERDPSRRRSGVGNVVVKNLDSSVDHEILQNTFNKFGRVSSCDIHQKNGTPIGFVQFDDENAAKLAIEKGNGLELNGRKLVVEKFYSKRENTNVFVKKFGEDMTDEELRESFGEFGEITSAKVEKDSKTGKSKGFGYVNYKTPEAATEAIEKMNGAILKGHKIYCALHQKKEERRALLLLKSIHRQTAVKQPGVTVYVRNLEDEIDDERLFKEFSTCGNVTKATVAKDKAGYSRGFGYVAFVSQEDAERAIKEMNGKTIISKPLHVDLPQSKERESYRATMTKAYVQQSPLYPVQSPAYSQVPNSGIRVAQGSPYQSHMAAHPVTSPQGSPYQSHMAAHLTTYPQGSPYQSHMAAHLTTYPQGSPYQSHMAAYPTTYPQGLPYQSHTAAQTYHSLGTPAPLHIPPSGFQASGGNVTAMEHLSPIIPMYIPSYTQVPLQYPSIARPAAPENTSWIGQSQDLPTPPRPNVVGVNGGSPWSLPSFQWDTESPMSSTFPPQFDAEADITDTSSYDSHPALQKEPELRNLMNLVAANIPDKYDLIGIQLGLSIGTLNSIASSPHAMERFTRVFSEWQKQQKTPYKWSTVINALEAPSIGENSLAQYIVDKLTK